MASAALLRRPSRLHAFFRASSKNLLSSKGRTLCPPHRRGRGSGTSPPPHRSRRLTPRPPLPVPRRPRRPDHALAHIHLRRSWLLASMATTSLWPCCDPALAAVGHTVPPHAAFAPPPLHACRRRGASVATCFGRRRLRLSRMGIDPAVYAGQRHSGPPRAASAAPLHTTRRRDLSRWVVFGTVGMLLPPESGRRPSSPRFGETRPHRRERWLQLAWNPPSLSAPRTSAELFRTEGRFIFNYKSLCQSSIGPKPPLFEL